MKIGDTAEQSRRFTAQDMEDFATLAGLNTTPDHVPEPLIAALFSHLLGVELPGPGTNYLKQDIRYLTPAPREATITARVEITRLRPEKHLVDLWATARSGDGSLIAEGRALVLAKDTGRL